MRTTVIVSAIVALGACIPALAANDFSYSYVEAGYINTENNGGNGDGLNLFGTLAFLDELHGFASYSTQSFDNNVDVDFFQAGIGLNMPVRPKLDFIGRISFVTVDVKGPGFRVDDNGYALNASLRTRVLGELELSAGFNYQDLDQGGEDTSINLGARYYLNPNIALGLDILQNNGDTTAIIGARYDLWQYMRR
jgi:hypothetical protein